MFKQAGGYEILEFDIAVNGWKQNEVNYFKVTLFGKQAVALKQYAVKGKQVAVVGSIKINKWTTSEGETKMQVCINASGITLLADPKNSAAPVAQEVTSEDDPLVF
jgi:single-strand DNA-binding protein